jgi:hypothetical protein
LDIALESKNPGFYSTHLFQKKIQILEDNMNKFGSLFIGVFLVALGVLSLAGNLLLSTGAFVLTGAFQLWPVIVIGIGMLFVMPPFFFRGSRGLAGLFIPGIPVLTTGLILLACSLSGNYGLWTVLWPLEVIAVGVGFLMAAFWMDVIWLLIPALLIGMLGLALQFTALTGLWSAWAVLWVVLPLSLGMAFIIIGLKRHETVLSMVGAGFCAFAGVAFAGISAFTTFNFWLLKFAAPLFVIGMGLVILALGFSKPKNQPEVNAEPQNAELQNS